MAAVLTLTAVGAASDTDIHTATGDEQLVIRIVNQSGGAGVINGLSQSSTTATQFDAGNILPAGFPIADKQVITITGITANTTYEFIVLDSSVAVQTAVSGWQQ